MESFDIRIEKLVYGGDALAHHDGRTVFVPYAIGGELERVTPIEQKKKFVRAEDRPGAGAGGRSCGRSVPEIWRVRRVPLPAHELRGATS